MATDKRITELPEASSIDGTEYSEIVQGGANKKVLTSKYFDYKNRTFALAFSDEETPIAIGTNNVTFHFPYTATLLEVWVGLNTAQTSGSIFRVDVHKNGVSIFSTLITVDNGEETSLTATTPPVMSVSSVAKGDKITVHTDQVGDGTAIGGKIYFRG